MTNMTWRAPTWRPLSPEEVLDPEGSRTDGTRLELWATSPSGLPVAACGLGLDMACLTLYLRGFHDAVYNVLDTMSNAAMPSTAAIDFFIGYDMSGHVAHCLEEDATACDYVLALPPSTLPDLDERITRAKDLARTSLAKRYALEAINELGLGLVRSNAA